jgi:hypothetical protein
LGTPEVIFVDYCVLQLAYCAVVVVEDFDAVEVCCEAVVAMVLTYAGTNSFSFHTLSPMLLFAAHPHHIIIFL